MKQVIVRTYSGRLFNCTDVDPSKFDIVDIAHSLSMQCRFNGATRKFFSVAEHCVVGSHLVEPACALGYLLHDGSEGYISDIIHPLKVELPEYLELEDHLQGELERHFGIDKLNAQQRAHIHACDKWSARREGEALIHDYTERYPVPIFQPRHHFDYAACGLAWQDAKVAFLRRYAELI